MASLCQCGHQKEFHDPDAGDCTVFTCGCVEYRAKQEAWTTFSVGLPPNVDEYRKQAEDRIARVVFHKPDRKAVYKPKLWEKLLTAIALASDGEIKRLFGDGGM